MTKRSFAVLVAGLIALLSSAAVTSADFIEGFSPYDDFVDIALAYAHVPSTNTLADAQSYTTEAGERVHDCRRDLASGLAPASGTHSIWLQVHFAGGTLTLDTSGSDYDTVMSVYRPAGTFADLQTVACSDQQPFGISDAKITAVLSPGNYFVQISRYSMSPTAAVLTLELEISAVYSGIAPANDHFAAAQAIAIGQTIVTKNVEFATEEAAEPPLSCVGPNIPSHSVWYSFDPGPRFAHLNISLEGSRLDSGSWVSNDTVLEVFAGSTLETLTSVACNNDTLDDASALSNVNAGFATPVFIRVSEFNNNSIWRPSSYKIKLTAGFYGGFAANGGFENAFSGEWKEKNLSGADGRLCGLGLGFTEDCAYQFTGGDGENSKLSQTLTLPANLRPAKGSHIALGFALNSQSTLTNVKATLLVKYTDGTPASKQTLVIAGSPGPDYEIYSMLVEVKSKKIGKITIQFNNKTTSGVLWLDNIGVSYNGGYTRGAADGLLPLPPAPAR